MSDKKEFIKKVAEVQAKLKAPKGQFNKFGNYAYRSCEDILEAVKPLLAERGLVLTINDEVRPINEDRVYVQAIATITDGENCISNSAFARESLDKKGMDDAQITGSTSSYARKYALNGLFLIDDTKDADATNTHGKGNDDQRSFSERKEEVKSAPVKSQDNSTVKVEVTNTNKPTSSFKRPIAKGAI